MYNMITSEIDALGCTELLEEAGVELTAGMRTQLDRYADLIREWNDYASLVSVGDAGRLARADFVDSLSLVPWLGLASSDGGILLDIGSGGGFPGVPLKVVRPGLELVLIERSSRKVGFLRRVVGALSLDSVDIVQGDFPVCEIRQRPSAITARAVEKPHKIQKSILTYLPEGCAYLCQSGDPRPLASPMFHVEQVDDIWRRKRLRRGDLYLVTKTPL